LSIDENFYADISIIAISGVTVIVGSLWFHRYQKYVPSTALGSSFLEPFVALSGVRWQSH
jgi:hypothetical protein